jgi:hypothetical protein
MYAGMYVCMHACMYVCMQVCMYQVTVQKQVRGPHTRETLKTCNDAGLRHHGIA